MSDLRPLKLTAACKDYLWGGTRLMSEYHQKSTAQKVAESWELSCHPDGLSVVSGGDYDGLTLPEYIKRAGNRVLGTDCEKIPYFPVLIKLIDAKDNLSIQVHPDNDYAQKHEGGLGKTEMWYIVDCEPDSWLYYGFDHPISKDEFRRRIEDSTLPEVLNKVRVHKGDVFFIDSGTLHAIGAGILIAEVQQNSNITYRIYDYGRLGNDGKPRQLHIEQAIDVTKLQPPTKPAKPQGTPETFSGYMQTLLSSCEYFTVYHMDINEAQMTADKNSFHSIVCLGGDGLLLTRDGIPLAAFRKGDSVFVPAGMGTYVIKGDCEILLTAV